MNQTTNTTASIDLAQLDKLEALARAAKANTWTAVKHSWSNIGIYSGGRPVACLSIIDDALEETQDALEAEMDADAAFMVAACNALSALVPIVRPSLTSGAPAEDTVREHLARVFDAMPANETLRGSQIAGRIRAGMSAGAAAKTDHAECWSDAVPCNKCGAIGWHNCSLSASAAGAGSNQALADRVVEWSASHAPSVTVQDERALFEATMGADILAGQGEFALSRAYSEGRPYTFLATIWAWKAWQARAALAHPVQDGEKDALTQAAVGIQNLAPVISSYDIEKVKALKFKFVDSMIHSGIQYRTCSGISAVLNQIIDDSEAAAQQHAKGEQS